MDQHRVRRTVVASFLLMAGSGILLSVSNPAGAATQVLFAAPSATGAGDCSAPSNACTIDSAVTITNAAPVTDSVRITLAGGTYPVNSTLAITFAGPSVALRADGATPTFDGADTVQLFSIAAPSTVTMDGLALTNGKSAGQGGAIANAGRLTVDNSTMSGNEAGNGGAISNAVGGVLVVEDSRLSGNTTTSVGGGVIINFGEATVKRSAIVNNTAPINGGGVNVQPGGVTVVTNSTLAGNTSSSLGGALSSLGTLTIQSSTIFGNSGSSGSALAVADPTKVTLASTIIAEQTSGTACNPANGAFVDAGYNLDTDGTCISAAAPATGSHNGTTPYGDSTYGAILNAYLANALADNGGPTPTLELLMTADPATALANPAFNVVPAGFSLPVAVDGNSAACAVPDQRGVVGEPGADCSIGAFQLSTCAGLAGTVYVGAGERPTTGSDVIIGTIAKDVIRAGRGKDIVCAGSGNDKVFGGAGNDRIFGGPGKDRLVGGAGKDRLRGGPGRDRLSR